MLLYVLLYSIVCGKTVYLMREAEKDWNADAQIQADSQTGLHLSSEGRKRAQCIASSVFGQGANHTVPKQILAQQAGRAYSLDAVHPSYCVDTAQPLAQRLQLKVDSTCSNVSCVMHKVRDHSDSPLLVVWSRWGLRRILRRAGIDKKNRPHYPKDRYDLLWELDTQAKTVKQFTQDCSKYGIYQNGTTQHSYSTSNLYDDSKTQNSNISLMTIIALIACALFFTSAIVFWCMFHPNISYFGWSERSLSIVAWAIVGIVGWKSFRLCWRRL
jgi:hypothetical protein